MQMDITNFYIFQNGIEPLPEGFWRYSHSMLAGGLVEMS